MLPERLLGCKRVSNITGHHEGDDEDGEVLATLVTQAAIIWGADHVQLSAAPRRRVGGRWIIVYVSSTSFGTETSSFTTARNEDRHSSVTSSIDFIGRTGVAV
jgi:hypothetical protein